MQELLLHKSYVSISEQNGRPGLVQELLLHKSTRLLRKSWREAGVLTVITMRRTL